MTFIDFITETAPKMSGVNRYYGKAAKLILEAEKEDPTLFPASGFETVRERARLLLPYEPAEGRKNEYELALDVVELKMLDHENEAHKGEGLRYTEDTVQRQLYLESKSPEAFSIAESVRGFWNE